MQSHFLSKQQTFAASEGMKRHVAHKLGRCIVLKREHVGQDACARKRKRAAESNARTRMGIVVPNVRV